MIMASMMIRFSNPNALAWLAQSNRFRAALAHDRCARAHPSLANERMCLDFAINIDLICVVSARLVTIAMIFKTTDKRPCGAKAAAASPSIHAV